eukprot:CAMPEP_0194026834 /NCGR_PEP_ID=MMETSP0009_2-20130614/1095_1 /TAXON_ID=210454 /ORGANISM="Grammatophora oceanica, Strain CCMP 410" /LENGTH=325 /DNA_ID=CAMNT_0038665701 /DNA_START=8 /DNA_END=985 /DNA_ORIENTATION=-
MVLCWIHRVLLLVFTVDSVAWSRVANGDENDAAIHDVKSNLYELVDTQEDMHRVLASSDQALHFYVMGDVPYLPRERLLLPQQLAGMEARASFAVHVGDIKKRSTTCQQGHYTLVGDMFDELAIPTLAVPGDNDWFECEDKKGAYNLWNEFFGHNTRGLHHVTNVQHQATRPENFAFEINDILVMGLHVVHASAANSQSAANMLDDISELAVEWIQQQMGSLENTRAVVMFAHAIPFHPKFLPVWDELKRIVQDNPDVPFLYLQGDLHKFQADTPMENMDNFLRVVVDKGGNADPMEVIVDPASQGAPFKLRRRPLSVYQDNETS